MAGEIKTRQAKGKEKKRRRGGYRGGGRRVLMFDSDRWDFFEKIRVMDRKEQEEREVGPSIFFFCRKAREERRGSFGVQS